MPRRGFKTEPKIEQCSKSTGNPFIFLLVLVFISYWGMLFFSRWRRRLARKKKREECVWRVWKERGRGGDWGKKREVEGRRVSRTVTFTRYDMATLTRCPPRHSAKLLSQSAPVSRSQPSAAPVLLGRGLVPQPNPGVGRRCHCPTVKRGFEILNTHTDTHTGPLIHPGNLPSNHLSCFAMLRLGHS